MRQAGAYELLAQASQVDDSDGDVIGVPRELVIAWGRAGYLGGRLARRLIDCLVSKAGSPAGTTDAKTRFDFFCQRRLRGLVDKYPVNLECCAHYCLTTHDSNGSIFRSIRGYEWLRIFPFPR